MSESNYHDNEVPKRQHNQTDMPEQKLRRPQKHHKPRPHKSGCFFWALFVFVILAIIGSIYIKDRYDAAKKTANKIYNASNITKARDVNAVLKEGKPVSILLMGTDTGALGRTFQGRTDTLMVVVLNPTKKTMTIVSIPRDAEVAVYGYEQYFPSKINSAYAYGGSATAIKTVQKYLNVPIDFYATVNMGGLENLVNAVGGVDVNPLLTFSYDNQSFTKGTTTHMNGTRALAYVRMRDDDPLGDYGRQARQRQVLTKLAFKSTKLVNLLNDGFLKTLTKQMTTDLTFNDLLYLGTKYRVATHHMKTYSLQGSTELIDSQDFEVVSTSEKQHITNILRKSLGLVHATTGSTLSSSNSINTTDSN